MADWENGDQQQSHDLDDADEQQSQEDDNQVADDVSFQDDNNEEEDNDQNSDEDHDVDNQLNMGGHDDSHHDGQALEDSHHDGQALEDSHHDGQALEDSHHDGQALDDFHDEGQDQNENHDGQDQFENLEDQDQFENLDGQDQDENTDGMDQVENYESQDQKYENDSVEVDVVVGQNQNETASQFDQASQPSQQVDTNINSRTDNKPSLPEHNPATRPSAIIVEEISVLYKDSTPLEDVEEAIFMGDKRVASSMLSIPEINLEINTSVTEMDDPYFSVSVEATATVKFLMMPSGQVITRACNLSQNLESLKSTFASELKMSASMIMLMFDGKSMADSTTLADLGVVPNETVQLEMHSVDPINNPLKAYKSGQEYQMPDVITVRVITEDCETKDVVVEIERSRTKKPFLGGFRNKNTGTEFHNASAQTMHKPRPPPTTERFCRDTQTCEQRNMRQQTDNDTCTQMTGIRIYISNLQDKLLAPGEYCTADQYWAMILNKVLILQKNFRRWLAKRYVKKLKEDKEKRLEWERLEELRKKKEKEERLQREYARRINPRTKADFDRLLNCLEKWRIEEMQRIDCKLTGAEKKAAICMLLDQETELLSAIERHRNDANYENRATRIMNFLEKAAAPKMWQAHDGKLTYMDTPFTIRAKELRDIYNSINMKYLTQDERLDVLLTLKHTVKEHDCKLTQEIIELIDREADLLMRGVKDNNLTGLRKRICTLYLQYIKTPTFNPEAAKYLKVPQDFTTLRKNINYCHSCGCYLPSTEFFITTNSRNSGRCRHCQKIENEGRQRYDHTYFRVMLKALHKSEEAMQDGSTLCYLLQENDLRYLVENIWSNQSVLSAWCDPYDLVLCRWDKHQEWSPWNCILLTHDEAEAHKKLFSLEEGYGHVFIHKVTQKHNFAKNYFSRLPGMSEILRKNIASREMMKMERSSGVVNQSAGKIQQV